MTASKIYTVRVEIFVKDAGVEVNSWDFSSKEAARAKFDEINLEYEFRNCYRTCGSRDPWIKSLYETDEDGYRVGDVLEEEEYTFEDYDK